METRRRCMALDLVDDDKLIASYEQLHQPGTIWPEIPVGIRQAGILDMQIYRIGRRLFMIVEYNEDTDLKTAFGKMVNMPRQDEWALLMGRFQQKLPEAEPDEHWAVMKPVFLLSEHLK